VNFCFGAKTINRTGDSPWNSKFIGEAVLDPLFDPTKETV